MADIDIHRSHNLGLEAARTAAENMAEHLGRKFGLSGSWHGNVLTFERPGVAGTLAITGKDLALSVTLGFLLKAMKGSIEAAVRSELDQLFAAAPGVAKKPPKASGKSAVKSRKAAARPKKGG